MLKKWSEIEIGDVFPDGSKVISKHEEYDALCYKIEYKKRFGRIPDLRRRSCTLSEDHLLLIDISMMSLPGKQWIKDNFTNYKIPTLIDRHIYFENLMENLDSLNKLPERIEDKAVKTDLSNVSDYEFWLPLRLIVDLVHMGEKLLCNNNIILSAKCEGIKRVFCVETDTNRFETCGLIHHNSVTLRNIILHCLTHGEEIAIALVDLKMTEFEAYKKLKNVVAVANDVREAVEILRIMRECMYARNREMAKLGINDIKDFKPQIPTDEVMIFNHRMKDTDTVEIKTKDGEIKTVTVKELEGYLQ